MGSIAMILAIIILKIEANRIRIFPILIPYVKSDLISAFHCLFDKKVVTSNRKYNIYIKYNCIMYYFVNIVMSPLLYC